MSVYRWLQRRECGLPSQQGDGDFIMNRVYKSLEPYSSWNDVSDTPNQTSEYGAVFNLEFSPEGNIVVAACEKKAILLFDAITTKQTHQITEAHTDNVNCIKFLDDRMFATCSDDTTVALWDLRYLKMKVRSLHGHSNWVKNIEYSTKDNLLVTSGFDGSIFTWDINSQTEQGLIYQKVFHTSGLMRCRIAPDGEKLVICTTGGYLMIIHNLDLTTLHKDLCGFRPSIYRLMQMGQQYIPQAAKFDRVFSKSQKKNRVELVTDFPDENDAEVVLALQIHPHGHSFLSRNISFDEQTEWSCVHDINEEPTKRSKQTRNSTVLKRKMNLYSDEEPPRRYRGDAAGGDYESGDSESEMRVDRRSRNPRAHLFRRGAPPPPPPPPTSSSSTTPTTAAVVQPPENRPESFVPDIWAAEVTVQERAIRQNRARTSNSVTGYNFVYAISSGVLPSPRAVANARRAAAPGLSAPPTTPTSRITPTTTRPSVETSDEISTSGSDSEIILTDDFPTIFVNRRDRKIFQNPKKLMYYIQESNKGKGFIKEPCFSSDGRIICSPYDTGVRLLGFSDDCGEYPRQCVLDGGDRGLKHKPRSLIEVKNISQHSEIVLSTKFSPREPLLVTGCRSGKVVWYHPNL